MIRHRWLMFMLTAFAVLITSCSNTGNPQSQDPAQAEFALLTDPSPVTAGQEAKVAVAVSGIADTTGADVQFDIRELDDPRHPNYVAAASQGDKTFAAAYTFRQAGSYTIYVHYYQQGLHLTKKKSLDVQ